MSAVQTFGAWKLACLSSGQGCGDNLLRLGEERFVIGDPRQLQNGALQGRIYRFTARGLIELGIYKIDADGNVVDLPFDELRGPLPMNPPTEPAPAPLLRVAR